MAGMFLYLTAMFLCVVQSALSAFSYVWHRRYKTAQLQGNRIIRNKIIAMACLVGAAGIMVFCAMHLPLTLYGCLTNGNMVMVTIFAYFILGERINQWQIATLVSLVVSSVMTAISVKPSLSNDFEDPLVQERKGKESLHKAGTIAFIVATLTFQLGCIFAMYRQQKRIRLKAERHLENMDRKSQQDIAIHVKQRRSVMFDILTLTETPTAEIVLKYFGFEDAFAHAFSYYFYLILGVHLVSFHPSMHGAMIKFVTPMLAGGDRSNNWVNWTSLGLLPVSWGIWLVFTGWLVTCFDANLATPLVYATQSLYGILVGIIVMGERPEWPNCFAGFACWMILSIAMFALVRDKEENDSKDLSATLVRAEYSKSDTLDEVEMGKRSGELTLENELSLHQKF